VGTSLRHRHLLQRLPIGVWRKKKIRNQERQERHTFAATGGKSRHPANHRQAGVEPAKAVVGFAAETENLVDNARDKLKKKGCDLIVANDVSKERGVFGGDKNTVQLVSASGVESWGLLSKQDVAQRLMAQLAKQLSA
jgi:phosphopantothenoylcysteine synthetase/decarboxylase